MDSKDFKHLFGSIAVEHGFAAAHGGWFLQANAALLVLNLQKSNYGNYYYLNIKFFLGRQVRDCADQLRSMVKNMSGDIFTRQENRFDSALDLEVAMTLEERRALIEQLFDEWIDRLAAGAGSAAGFLRLRDERALYLLPGIAERLTGG